MDNCTAAGAMGFGERELDVLKQPTLVALLVNARVPWCSVTVNHDVLWRLVKQAHEHEQEVHTVDRMLRLGASTAMVNEFFGLTYQEAALRRAILGMPKRKGRYPVLREEQETALWHCWKVAVASRSIALEDKTAMLDLTMDLAQSLSLPMSVIWAAIRSWIDQGLV